MLTRSRKIMNLQDRLYRPFITRLSQVPRKGQRVAQAGILVGLTVVLFAVASGSHGFQPPQPPEPPLEPLTAEQITAFDEEEAIPLSLTKTGEEVLRNVGAPESIQVVYTRNPEFNCGYRFMTQTYGKLEGPESDPKTWVTGCYQHQHEDFIFVFWGENTSYEYREFALLHEYGHYLQRQESSAAYFRYTQDSSEVVEQDADCRAIALGAKATGLSCAIAGWTWDWLDQQT